MKLPILSVLVVCCFLTISASASEKIAKVIATEGVVTLSRYDRDLRITNKDWLFTDDRILTGKDSSVELQMIDGSLVNLGEYSNMVLLELVFDPVKKDGFIDLKIVSGAFRIISGTIAKFGPELMEITLPSATVGIRGTSLLGRASKVGRPSFVILVPDPDGRVGEIVVQNTEGIVVLRKADEGVSVIYPDKKIAKKKYTKKFIEDLIKQVPKLRHNILHERQFNSLFWFRD